MAKNKFIISSFFGVSAVALGALGAHFLKSKLQLGLITPDQLDAFDTATKYQLFHAIVLLLMAFTTSTTDQNKWINYAHNCFVLGIILFSFSIYLLSTRNLTGITSISFLGPLTPIGGILLMLGWVFIGVYGFKLKRE